MSNTQDTVSKILFDYIGTSEEMLVDLMSQQKFKDVIDNMMAKCYDFTIETGGRAESLGALATSILHYLLTRAMIPSQRKASLDNIEVDVAVPDLGTLKASPEKALVIYVPMTLDPNVIRGNLCRLEKIQPEKQNIWTVLAEDLELENKTYIIAKHGGSFSKIIHDIAQFANTHGKNRFKIMGA